MIVSWQPNARIACSLHTYCILRGHIKRVYLSYSTVMYRAVPYGYYQRCYPLLRDHIKDTVRFVMVASVQNTEWRANSFTVLPKQGKYSQSSLNTSSIHWYSVFFTSQNSLKSSRTGRALIPPYNTWPQVFTHIFSSHTCSPPIRSELVQTVHHYVINYVTT